jgi:adenosylhomocysteine nucleosidase
MSKIVIIAAMEREVQPLAQGWKRATLAGDARGFVAFEKENCIVVICGIGSKNSEQAARAAVAQYRPATLISVGLAGALIRSLKAGSLVTPNVVVDAADGAEYRCNLTGDVLGGGILVSAKEIAGTEAKQKLVERFHGLVVDMEAAGVARVAQEAQIGFRCIKAISDEMEFVMPPMGRFVDAAGHFQSGKFALWAAMRPWQWGRVVALGRNSAKAIRVLCDRLKKDLAGEVRPKEVVTLNGAEFPDVASERP